MKEILRTKGNTAFWVILKSFSAQFLVQSAITSCDDQILSKNLVCQKVTRIKRKTFEIVFIFAFKKSLCYRLLITHNEVCRYI